MKKRILKFSICSLNSFFFISIKNFILSLPHGGPDYRKKRDIGDRFESVDRYDRENPCIGMKQIITGFSKWSDRYISSCNGQKKHSHQTKRMTKWGNILSKGKS